MRLWRPCMKSRGEAMLVSVERGGRRLMLLDCSEWTIRPEDTAVTSAWQPTAEIEFCDTRDGSLFPYLLINTANHTFVRARETEWLLSVRPGFRAFLAHQPAT